MYSVPGDYVETRSYKVPRYIVPIGRGLSREL